MNTNNTPQRDTAVRTVVVTAAGMIILLAAGYAAIFRGSMLVAAGLAAVALLVFALAPAIIGNAVGHAHKSDRRRAHTANQWTEQPSRSTAPDRFLEEN